jgi:hypothetical protein
MGPLLLPLFFAAILTPALLVQALLERIGACHFVEFDGARVKMRPGFSTVPLDRIQRVILLPHLNGKAHLLLIYYKREPRALPFRIWVDDRAKAEALVQALDPDAEAHSRAAAESERMRAAERSTPAPPSPRLWGEFAVAYVVAIGVPFIFGVLYSTRLESRASATTSALDLPHWGWLVLFCLSYALAGSLWMLSVFKRGLWSFVVR